MVNLALDLTAIIKIVDNHYEDDETNEYVETVERLCKFDKRSSSRLYSAMSWIGKFVVV